MRRRRKLDHVALAERQAEETTNRTHNLDTIVALGGQHCAKLPYSPRLIKRACALAKAIGYGPGRFESFVQGYCAHHVHGRSVHYGYMALNKHRNRRSLTAAAFQRRKAAMEQQ